MSSTHQSATLIEGDVDLLTLWRIVWAQRVLVCVIAALFAAGSVAVALLLTPTYRAEVVVTEVVEQRPGTGSSIANQLGGLASVAGINLPGQSGNRESRAVLHSRAIAQQFIERNELLHVLNPRAKSPSLWQAVKQFKRRVITINEDNRRGTITIQMDWSDPVLAAKWANDFVAFVNDSLRTRALEEAERNIAYITKQLQTTEIVELRRALFNLVETETRTRMLASGRKEYAFRVADPAVVPEERIKPQRQLVVLFGGALGLLMGILFAIARRLIQSRRQARGLV